MTHYAARLTGLGTLALLLACGCADSTPGMSTDDLLEAAAKNDLARVTLLVQENADVTAATVDGVTPLHHAALLGNVDMATLLLKNGADATAVTASEETTLHWAASGGSREVVRVLLKAGVDVNARNEDGQTALDVLQTRDGDFADFVKDLQNSGGKSARELDAEGPAEGEVVARKFRDR